MRASAAFVASLLLAFAFAGCVTAESKKEHTSGPGGSPGNKPDQPPGQAKKEFKGGFSDTSVFPGEYRMKKNYSLVLNPGPYEIGPPTLHQADSGFGGATQTILYLLPKNAPQKKFPVIVVASVYLGHLKTGNYYAAHNSNPEHIVPFLVENYVPHGYAVALVPVRGVAGNGGCYEWWGPNETEDLKRALKWIQDQPWAEKSLGLIGLSLAGSSAWMAAGLGDKAVKTIVPVSSETDFYTWFVRNGTPSVTAAQAGAGAFWAVYGVSPFPTSPDPGRDPSKIPDSLNCPNLPTAIAAGQYMTHTGAIDPFGWAAARDLRPAVEKNYKGSVFLITGLNDWLAYPHLVYPWADKLESNGVVIKHLLGQWRHRMPDDPTEGSFFQPTLRPDFAEILLRWFDYWLKEDKTRDLGPRVQVADSQNDWRNEADWPPRDAARQRWHPTPTNTLQPGPGASGSVNLTPDPARSVVQVTHNDPKTECPNCVFFSTTPLDKALRISGIPTLRVTATPHGPGGVVTAYLYAHTGTVYQRIGWATMDLRFADGGNTPKTVTRGVPITTNLEFEPLDAVVPPGSRLVLELFQGGYGEDITVFIPFNKGLAPNAFYRSSQPNYPVQVDLGGSKTYLNLPIIERGADAFFMPPPKPTPIS